MEFNVTPEDLLRQKPVDPGWYPLECTSVTFEVTKGNDAKPSDGSMNAIIVFKALDGPPNVKGRTFKRYFNEKAMFFGNALWATAFPGSYDKEKGGKMTTDMLKSLEGIKLSGYVKMDGKYPTIEDYRPLAQTVGA